MIITYRAVETFSLFLAAISRDHALYYFMRDRDSSPDMQQIAHIFAGFDDEGHAVVYVAPGKPYAKTPGAFDRAFDLAIRMQAFVLGYLQGRGYDVLTQWPDWLDNASLTVNAPLDESILPAYLIAS